MVQSSPSQLGGWFWHRADQTHVGRTLVFGITAEMSVPVSGSPILVENLNGSTVPLDLFAFDKPSGRVVLDRQAASDNRSGLPTGLPFLENHGLATIGRMGRAAFSIL